jgi:hypothetical protein
MRKITIYLLFTLLLAIACNKDDDGSDNSYGLPNATQGGANTFGCLINGEPWVAEIGPDVLSPSVHKFLMDYDEANFGVDYNNSWTTRAKLAVDAISESFIFNGINFTTATNLYVDLNSLDVTFYSIDNRPYFSYSLDEGQPYFMEITKLDTVENICSGMFECFLLSQNKLDTLHITEGRFDKKYDQF